MIGVSKVVGSSSNLETLYAEYFVGLRIVISRALDLRSFFSAFSLAFRSLSIEQSLWMIVFGDEIVSEF